MSADALRRLGLGCNWSPSWWHVKLAAFLPPMAVYGIFGNAQITEVKTGYCITFTEHDRLAAAQKLLEVVNRALGRDVLLFKPFADPRANLPKIADSLINDASRTLRLAGRGQKS